MRYVKRLLFFLAISVLVIGMAVPAGAEPKTKACGKVKDVRGVWTFDGLNHDFTAREEYTLPDDCVPGSADCTLVLGDYLSLTEMTGDIIALHMYLYSTYIYTEDSMELVEIARVHGKAFGEEIDVWGKTTFDMFPNDKWTEFEMTGSGRYMFPFRDCSPSVFLCYEGTYDGIDAEGTYEGVIIGSCK